MVQAHIIPNWNGGVKENYEFKTVIFTSESGKEQRSADRMTPRRTVEFKTVFFGDSLRDFKALMHNRLAQQITIPDPARLGVILKQDAPAGTTTLLLDPAPYWLAVGVTVGISTIGATEETTITSTGVVGEFNLGYNADFAVNAVAQVTLVSPLQEDWPAGSEIRPIITGRLPEDVTLEYQTSRVAEANINFSVTYPSQLVDLPEETPTMFRSREVLLAEPNWISPPTVQYHTDIEQVDYGRGIAAFFNTVDFYTKVSQFGFTDYDAGAIGSIVGLFTRMKGRRGEFWCPSWTSDMVNAEPIVGGQNTLSMVGRDLYDNYQGSDVEKAIAILKADGTWLLRYITDMDLDNTTTFGEFNQDYSPDFDTAALSGDGQYTRLTLSPGFTTGDQGPILMICWLNVCRFASDTLTVDWYSDKVARTILNIQTLEALDPET